MAAVTAFNMDSFSLEAAIDMVRQEGKPRPVGVIAIDMFGQPADHNPIHATARKLRWSRYAKEPASVARECNVKRACAQ